MKKTSFTLLAICITAPTIFLAIQKKSKNDNTIIVDVGTVTTATINETLSTTGLLVPIRSESLTAIGNVVEVYVASNDQVAKNQLLATYDSGVQIRAPFSGTITQINIQPNSADNNIQQGKPSIQLDDLSNLNIQLALASSEASAVKINQTVQISTNQTTFSGKVIEKAPTAITREPPTDTPRTLKAIVAFDTPPKTLIAGFEVDVDITTKTAENTLTIPIEALIYEDNNTPVVYTLSSNHAQKTKITVGIQSDTQVEVKHGLKENQKVILSPSSAIQNKTKLNIKQKVMP